MPGLKTLKRHPQDFLAYFLIFVFIIFFLVLSLGRHAALKSYQNDLGIYGQMSWNTLHGNFFDASGAMIDVTANKDYTINEKFNYLSAHFSPILLVLVPLYALWSDPRIFLIIQAIAVGLAALPIYWFAKDKTKNSWAGLVFLISFLLYPILHNALMYDFHEVTLAVPFLTFALWFWHKNKTGWLLFFLALLMISQEHLALIVFMFGWYLVFFQKRYKLGLSIAAVSLFYFLMTIFVFMPAFSTSGQLSLLDTKIVENRYSWLGSGLGQIFQTFIHKPLWVIKGATSLGQFSFFCVLILPLAALPIFSGLFILALPLLAINFLSHFTMTYSVYYYHSAVLSGLIYFSGIMAFARLIRKEWQKKLLLGVILILSLMAAYNYSVSPLGKNYSWQDYQSSANAKLVKEVQAIIPDGASLSIQHNLGPHFANRHGLFHFPFMIDKSEYIVVDVFNPYAMNPKSIFKFISATEVRVDGWLFSIYNVLNSQDFGVIYSKDGWLVLKRGANHDLNEKAKTDIQKFIIQVKESTE